MEKTVCIKSYYRTHFGHDNFNSSDDEEKVTCEECRKICLENVQTKINWYKINLVELREDMYKLTSNLVQSQVSMKELRRKWDIK